MKLYVKDAFFRQEITNFFHETITLVNTKKEAEYIISGAFSSKDWHPKLKGIIVPYTGLDSIDLEAVKQQRLKLFNTTVHSKFVAERALQLMFALTGHIINAHNDLCIGQWNRTPKSYKPWTSIIKRNIGIYGYGRIGQYIAQFLKPYNVQVYIINRGKEYDGVRAVETLEALVQSSDIVFIAAPLTQATKHAFNARILSQMKDRYLINVGRGNIIEEKDLFKALEDKKLLGFASDVWFRYPKKAQHLTPSNYPIEQFDNVVMTPHSGGQTTDSMQLWADKLINHIQNILKGNLDEALDFDRIEM